MYVSASKVINARITNGTDVLYSTRQDNEMKETYSKDRNKSLLQYESHNIN